MNNYHSSSLEFDDSQQQLLETTIESSKINFDAFDDDGIDVNEEKIELNVGGTGYSQKPLNSWNHRRTIVGPNG